MLFAALSNALYEIICYRYQLWQMEPNGLPVAMIPMLLLILIGMPLSTWVYLSNYPTQTGFFKQGSYIAFFTLIFVLLELISVQLGSITYHNGWNLCWSFVFDLIMFIMLRVHHRHPLVGLVFSVIYTGLLLILFDVSFDKMK
ncbi:CBO0543 family protein [Paenibacillus hexagrammi]|uniref:CBO0543 family protein n=1 Tax=Paenibacillus hexagrammi TaxID=2908839 RepID=UPI002882F93C|nr:CBO0543 family protein [Paenibacillus sp. YPD9-1]